MFFYLIVESSLAWLLVEVSPNFVFQIDQFGRRLFSRNMFEVMKQYLLNGCVTEDTT